MLSPDSFASQNRDDHDEMWRDAEDLIDRMDRRSRHCDDQSQFEQEVAEALRKFSSCSGVSIQKRCQNESLVVAKSGISIFQGDELARDPSRHLIVSQSLTETTDLETQLCFEKPVTTQQKRVFTETMRALTNILIPVVLRREISVVSDAMQSLDRDHQLVESLFAGSTVNETYHSIAKTLATLTHTDRVCIVRANHRKHSIGRLVASSVPTDIDPRARQAQDLVRLIQDDHTRDQYIQENAVQQIYVEPIADHDNQVLAWVVFEQYDDTETAIAPIAIRFAPHQDLAHRAVKNAIAREIAGPRSAAKTLATVTPIRWAQILAVAAVVFLAMWLVKVPLRLSVPGRIAAAAIVTKHSPTNGFVTKVHVADGDRVTKGMPLLQLHSPELELVAQRLSSELATTTTKIDTLKSVKRNAGDNQTSAERMVLQTEADGIQRQLELVRQEQESLVLRSTIAGIVRQWDAKESLAGRVVVIGQPLLEIIDPAAGWNVELDIPDDQVGYLDDQQKAKPTCSFRVLSSPTEVHEGVLNHIDQAAQLNEAGHSIVRAEVSIDTDQANRFRRGASVVAKVDCGQRSAAFVVFRGLVQWWRTQDWI
ncbi:HlyD family secretion protein [Rubripirellula obstinata]|uniref:HlyD family secretion protein n=1 Tax=Rubripirellula obstinata TaxID=406547 RepID=A0A5B1CHH0_9BACT|nr:efflux RND transporter periplasmic adaptor subunit [Rubripirellula obstinata]KAA1259642.1 HlyD family secretion protein [Rubripirellula obstinata]